MGKEDVVCINNGILFSHEEKKKENLAICKNAYGPWEYYAKWSRPGGGKQAWADITYMLNLKIKANSQK